MKPDGPGLSIVDDDIDVCADMAEILGGLRFDVACGCAGRSTRIVASNPGERPPS